MERTPFTSRSINIRRVVLKSKVGNILVKDEVLRVNFRVYMYPNKKKGESPQGDKDVTLKLG